MDVKDMVVWFARKENKQGKGVGDYITREKAELLVYFSILLAKELAVDVEYSKIYAYKYRPMIKEIEEIFDMYSAYEIEELDYVGDIDEADEFFLNVVDAKYGKMSTGYLSEFYKQQVLGVELFTEIEI